MMNRQSKENFQDTKAILGNTTMVDTHHYTFVKTHRMHTKSEPQCKLWTLGDNRVST